MWITKLTRLIELSATRSRLVYCFVSVYYRLLIKREVKLAEINENDRVLCIGGGICPYTAILLNKYTNAFITVVDNNINCVEKSRTFVNRLGLDRVKIIYGDGRDICCHGYTVIHLAMQLTPKESVLNEIMKKADHGTRILIRNPRKGIEKLYCKMSDREKDFVKCIKHSFLSNVDYTSVCIVNKNPVGNLS
ncbi:MAG: hypothetical protein GX854_09745 [Clostridiales bacterium]|nr:hypothetical protein [Clostridiales bacterium]